MSTGWQEYYKANREKILKRQKAWYRKNKSNSRKKMTAEERRMAKNECEARRREKLKKADGEPEIIDPMPKMAKGVDTIREFLQKINLKKGCKC